jgi:peptidoglycan/xylan/chitin deacetylase (PgdA/CDA1 family)
MGLMQFKQARLAFFVALFLAFGLGGADAKTCSGKVYLTLDTGNMSQAQFIKTVLDKHQVKATFFLANEKTPFDNYSLDDAWKPYWQSLVQDGHLFANHTFDHVFFRGVTPDGKVVAKPQFGAQAGTVANWNQQSFCAELGRVAQRFEQLTGARLLPLWRAPSGKAPPAAMAMAQQCGYAHVHWATAGFLGDELPSDKYPNQALLKQALSNIQAGDILMAHLGIWSRKEVWAPMLDPLIAGLHARGLCFATLAEHPQYKPWISGVGR